MFSVPADFIAIVGVAVLIILVVRVVRRRPPKDQRWVVIDGSNVMYWKTQSPLIEPVQEVVNTLRDCGYTVGVMFDANVGYLLSDHYMHDGAFKAQLGLPADQIMVVPKGTPADPYILTAAQDLGACIVTNDRFRDWASDYPQINQPGFLVKGGYKSGKLWLAIDDLAHSV